DIVLVEIDGVPILTLGPSWAIAFAAVQLYQDLFILRRVVDLAAILARSPPSAAVAALPIARAFGCAGVLKLGARLAAELGAPVSPLLAGSPLTALQRWLDPRLSF